MFWCDPKIGFPSFLKFSFQSCSYSGWRKGFGTFSIVEVLFNNNKMWYKSEDWFLWLHFNHHFSRLFLGRKYGCSVPYFVLKGTDVILDFQSSNLFVLNKPYNKQGTLLVAFLWYSLSGMQEHCIRCCLSLSITCDDSEITATLWSEVYLYTHYRRSWK
jgi:hypothetical protein